MGRKVEVEVGLSEVRIVYQNKVIAKHKRNLGKKQWILDPWHYLPTLQKKSRAFSSSRILLVMENEWHPVVLNLWRRQTKKFGEYEGTKEFLSTLMLFSKITNEEMITVLQLVEEESICSKEMIESFLETLTENCERAPTIKTEELPESTGFSIPQPDISKFDILLKGACNGE